ncbi:triacylglycerol lipase [Amycolatopsis sp. EV170708-02-1]|uniref:esterase/lipase family protein n=1 Tax=Amycolatopsis sp. EV170708-02-1 TaxID=2919322 RepID=UPI001F0C9071|nr:alpha/beta hydrolase [Amycolatopsis sp. EV170708-02-1]UMP06735.1 hypothetical protein MJQ72_18835 [Amycolatopsis sp. EV170708-02-1]
MLKLDPAECPNRGEGVVREPVGALRLGLLLRSAAGRLPLLHEAQALCQRRVIEQHELWRHPPLDADGLAVVLVGGLGSTPTLLSPLEDLLRRLGCQVKVAPVRLGIGCGEMTAQLVEAALVELTEAVSAPAVVIAHSRGGQFARAVALRRPELLRGLITLGAPLTRMLAVHPLLLAQIAALGAAGALGVPGLLRPGCRWGGCCARLRADLAAPFPEGLPFLSVYSRTDRVVDWRSSCDPAARHQEVRTSHGGLIWDPVGLTAIVDELVHLLATSSPAVQDPADQRLVA